MTDTTYATSQAGHEALETLRLMMNSPDMTDAARVSAAKALFDRFIPKDDAERKQREADERAAALIDAQRFLAEFAAAKLASLCEPGAVDPDRAPATNHAAAPPAQGIIE